MEGGKGRIYDFIRKKCVRVKGSATEMERRRKRKITVTISKGTSIISECEDGKWMLLSTYKVVRMKARCENEKLLMVL